jgi:hypothetical protein
MAQIINDPNGGINGGLFNQKSTPVLCNDGSTQTETSEPNAKVMDACRNNGGRAENKGINPKLYGKTPEETKKYLAELESKSVKKDLLTSSNLTFLAKASIVPISFYAFSKYQKYDSKKTLKVTIIGSVVVLGAIVFNSLSGMWSGNTFMDSKFGKQKYW